MFGLMRAKKCGMSEKEKHFRRLNYCGTCKTIGSLYGQKSRLLLNHDTVFLAELLSAVGGENVAEWQKSYQSFNCLSLPASEMPVSLQFAATTNIILTEFKLADHLADEKKRRYKLAQSAFSKEFQAAEKLLTGWNFPLAEVKAVLESQNRRETAGNSLDELAFPTAQTTAIFFREGVKQTGKNELGKLAFEIGFNFGKLVYFIDAFEDYEKDFRTQQFNALRAAFGLTDEKLTARAKRKIGAVLYAVESEISAKIHELPIAENQKTLFVSRLSQNLQRKLKPSLPVLKTTKVCAPKQTFAQRWQNAAGKARGLAHQYGWQMPLVFLFVFAFALVAPAQSREARSARECFDLSFNLMTLGAIFASVMAFPKTLLMENPEEVLTKKGRRKKLAQAAGGGSDDSGDWCDTCCCCCDCGDGCCDGCDCFSGCCDNCGCDGCCDCSCDC
ncbi:MAG TPA: DUF5685 family protein [Pyrinomonadaceae bacterium]|nr:DUF5685 family protein [Pyrinomonadaceae bacterium]